MSTLRKLAAASVAAFMLAALTACNNDQSAVGDTPASSSPATESDSTPPSDEPSDEPSQGSDDELSASNFQKEITDAQASVGSYHMEGVFDLKAAGQKMQMNFSADMSGAGDPDSTEMAMKMDMMGQAVEFRLVDKAIYMTGAALGGNPKKPWIKIDADDPNSPFASLFETADPQQFTGMIDGAKGVKNLGAETVDGVKTTHYEVTVDTKKALAASGELGGMDPGSMGFPAKMKIGFWVNADHLPVQMEMPFGKLGSFEVHLSKFGEPVHIKAPPANQVTSSGAAG